MSYSAMAWHPHICSHLLRPGPYTFFERYLLLINVCFSRAIALIYCSKQTMVPPATTSSKKRRRKKQSEVFLEPTPNRRRSEESPPAVTQTQPFPSSNGHSTPSPNHPQTLIGSPPINGEPPVPTTNLATPTNLDSAIVLLTIATTGPSIRTNISSGQHIAFGSQATPTNYATAAPAITFLEWNNNFYPFCWVVSLHASPPHGGFKICWWQTFHYGDHSYLFCLMSRRFFVVCQLYEKQLLAPKRSETTKAMGHWHL